MKVRVTKTTDSFWYKVGEIFEVENHTHDCWHVPEGRGGKSLYKANCEIIPDEPRIYKHEDKEYILPEWAKYVTCDGKGLQLFAWENEPYNKGNLPSGRANFQTEVYMRRSQLEEYVRPLPEGAFIEAV